MVLPSFLPYVYGVMSDHSSELGHVRPWRHIERRKSRQIMVGSVPVGGGAPISVQSMTNTPVSYTHLTLPTKRIV